MVEAAKESVRRAEMAVSQCLQEIGSLGYGKAKTPVSPHRENKSPKHLVLKIEGLKPMSLYNQEVLELRVLKTS